MRRATKHAIISGSITSVVCLIVGIITIMPNRDVEIQQTQPSYTNIFFEPKETTHIAEQPTQARNEMYTDVRIWNAIRPFVIGIGFIVLICFFDL